MLIMNKLLLLGCLYSDSQKEVFYNKSKKGYQFAAQKFQEALIEGFLRNQVDLTVVTYPSLSTFPVGYKDLYVKQDSYIFKNATLGVSLGFYNIPFVNRPSLRRSLDYLEKWYKDSGEKQSTIVVYGLHKFQLSLAFSFKKRHENVGVCAIVPDLPEYMGCNNYYKKLGLKDRDTRIIYEKSKCIDHIVFLSEKMKVRFPVQRPYVVVEGIVNEKTIRFQNKETCKTILYTGGVYSRYGVLDLVKAFTLIKDPNYRLWICGNGDAVADIEQLSTIDNRILYLGVKNTNEVEDLQQRATLLVNPRHSNEIFTDYSFPSKTMEYLMSGTATVMCHLGCIPQEYDDYLFYFEDESIEGMKRKMVEICEMDKTYLRERGEKASLFIKNNKNSKAQTKKILDLIVEKY